MPVESKNVFSTNIEIDSDSDVDGGVELRWA